MKELMDDLKSTGNLVGVRFYRLTFKEARQGGWRITLYWIIKKLLRLGTYGHAAIVIPALGDRYEATEYTLTDKGLDVYSANKFVLYSNDTVWLKYDVSLVLHLIEQWGKLVGTQKVTILSLATALSYTNKLYEFGCCTHFVSYCLSVPITTLADELCLKILSSDMSHVPVVGVKIMSEYGAVETVEKRSIASVVNRRLELGLIRKCLGLYNIWCILQSSLEGLRRKPVSSMTLEEQEEL